MPPNKNLNSKPEKKPYKNNKPKGKIVYITKDNYGFINVDK